MKKKPENPHKRPGDPLELAKLIGDIAMGNVKDESGKDPRAVARGKMGGAKGGKARAEKLDPAKRKEIAQQAIKARWAKKD